MQEEKKEPKSENQSTFSEKKKEDKKEKPKKKISLRMKIILFETLLILIVAVAFWGYYSLSSDKLKKAEEITKESEIIKQEKERCTALVAQEGGDFDDYDYCKRFLRLITKQD